MGVQVQPQGLPLLGILGGVARGAILIQETGRDKRPVELSEGRANLIFPMLCRLKKFGVRLDRGDVVTQALG